MAEGAPLTLTALTSSLALKGERGRVNVAGRVFEDARIAETLQTPHSIESEEPGPSHRLWR